MKNPATNSFACTQIDKLILLLANKKINKSAYVIGCTIVTNPGSADYLSQLLGWSLITVKRSLAVLEGIGYAEKMAGDMWITKSALLSYNININNDLNNTKILTKEEIDNSIMQIATVKIDEISEKTVEHSSIIENTQAELENLAEENNMDQGDGENIYVKNIAEQIALMFGLQKKTEQIKKIINDVKISYSTYTYLIPDAVVQAGKYTIKQIKKRFYRIEQGKEPVRNVLGYFKYMIRDNMKKAVETELVRINSIGARNTMRAMIGKIQDNVNCYNKNKDKSPVSTNKRVMNEYYGYIKEVVGDFAFNEYFKCADINKIENVINIKVDSLFVRDWINERYHEKLENILKTTVVVVAA